ncbi:class A beta-lactamase-related serine hydrolase [Deinococcus aquaticus]|uniref:Class A beta-lactamase-related serine hydrolase n=1 Tax=Deinococcus aquaticus TaxID=328692 RepID=A0ABY7V290_9DEIO|nr:serine hydrolase [Deinococcus aquaticus]WDA59299.1 class A beta-lactamase-related serine hydrolase [Deinococcus aquaticus]
MTRGRGEQDEAQALAGFEARLRDAGFAGTVGLWVGTLDGQPVAVLNEDRVFPAASTIKVPLLVMALQAAQRGDLSLDGRVTLRAEDRVPGAGVLHELGAGLALSWQDVLTLMIIVSDNTATNLVIEQLGVDDVNDWLTEQRLGSTRLVGKLQLPPGQRNEAQRRGERNATTARDQAALLRRLVTGELLDAAHTALALGILERQQYRDLIGRGVPADATGTPLYRVASKSGELTGVHHDVGVVFTPRPLVVALLTEGGRDLREHPDNRDVVALAPALWALLSASGRVPDSTGESRIQGDI